MHGEEIKYINEAFNAIHKGLDKLGFKDYIKRELQSGLVVAALYPDDPNWEFIKVHDYCYERGFTIYPGKVEKKGMFRLCALGAIDVKDIEDFFVVFEEALKINNITIPVVYKES